MSNRGTQRENYVKDWLEERGWWVCRAAGSLGDADLVALRQDHHRIPVHRPLPFPELEIDGRTIWMGKLLIEVKSTKAGPFSDFGPQDRADLLKAGEIAGADVVLCWCPPQRKAFEKTELHWIWPKDWPKDRRSLAA